MAQVQLDCMQLCHWSMPTAVCKVHRVAGPDTFDTILTDP